MALLLSSSSQSLSILAREAQEVQRESRALQLRQWWTQTDILLSKSMQKSSKNITLKPIIYIILQGRKLICNWFPLSFAKSGSSKSDNNYIRARCDKESESHSVRNKSNFYFNKYDSKLYSLAEHHTKKSTLIWGYMREKMINVRLGTGSRIPDTFNPSQPTDAEAHRMYFH